MDTRKRTLISVAVLSAIIILAVAPPGIAQQRRAGAQIRGECDGGLPALFDAIEIVPLTTADEADIVFLREEEKLARDVYLELGRRWQLPIFRNIARSEQRHMDLVLRLIETYEIVDPVADDTVGVFTDPSLAALFTELVAKGEISIVEALEVGAIIEDMDLADLYELIDDTDNRHVILVASNLAKGSRNHLRAFIRALTAQGVVYVPQYLDQQTFDEIIASEMERNVVYDADGTALDACGEGSPGWGNRRGRPGGEPIEGRGSQGENGGPHGEESGECDGQGSTTGNGGASGECDGEGPHGNGRGGPGPLPGSGGTNPNGGN